MKKLLPLLVVFLCCNSALSAAITPEEGVYLIIPEYASRVVDSDIIPEHQRKTAILSQLSWENGLSPALLVFAGGYLIGAHGSLFLDFSKDPTVLNAYCPQIYLELEKTVIRQQSDGEGYTFSFNVSEDESAPPTISAGSSLAMYGVLEFTDSKLGLFTVTSSMSFLTKQLQPGSCTTTNRMYVVKL